MEFVLAGGRHLSVWLEYAVSSGGGWPALVVAMRVEGGGEVIAEHAGFRLA